MLWSIFFNCRNQWLASVIAITLFFFSNHASGAEYTDFDSQSKSVLDCAETKNADSMRDVFDQLQESMKTSRNTLEGCQIFLQSFISEINTRYGLHLTFQEACLLIQQNIDLYPEDMQKMLLSAIELINQKEFCVSQLNEERISDIAGLKLYWPWEWNWFKSHKKHTHHPVQLQSFSGTTPSPMEPKDELPGDIYVGACELLAGALLAILPHPVTKAAAGMIMADGIKRLADGTVQLGEERRNNPYYQSPQNQSGFNF